MSTPKYLNINGAAKLTTEVDYDDLLWLYGDFKRKYGRAPRTSECTATNNLPQGRIVMRVLEEAGVPYKTFMNSFGDVSHMRAHERDYDLYVGQYKKISDERGKYITSDDLVNSAFGLPSPGWFVKHCPDKDVKSFTDFITWCGYHPFDFNKGEVSDALIEYEKQLGRPIVRTDISKDKIGFSMIVINRLFGGLTECKKQLGLMATKPNMPIHHDIYISDLSATIDRYKELNPGVPFITWMDIEDGRYNPKRTNHKTIMGAFDRAGININTFLLERGLHLGSDKFSNQHVFPDGERTSSSLEYEFSLYLRNHGYEYEIDYKRGVLYRSFIHGIPKSKMDCDYVITAGGQKYYIEIAGMISNSGSGWESKQYEFDRPSREYKEKMINKKAVLESNGLRYLFLFPEDFKDGSFEDKFLNLITPTNNNTGAA